MERPCLICGGSALEEHHPTARRAGDRSPYLDPDLKLPVCHDDHQLFGDDQKRLADLESDRLGDRTLLEWLEVRLRRVAAFGSRCAEANASEWVKAFISLAAAHLDRWADELASVIDALDVAYPTWRTIQAVHG